MAISRHSDGETVSAKLDDYNCEGVFKFDGRRVNGTRGSLTQEELAYLIWKQMQNPKWSEERCRQEWEKLGKIPQKWKPY